MMLTPWPNSTVLYKVRQQILDYIVSTLRTKMILTQLYLPPVITVKMAPKASMRHLAPPSATVAAYFACRLQSRCSGFNFSYKGLS